MRLDQAGLNALLPLPETDEHAAWATLRLLRDRAPISGLTMRPPQRKAAVESGYSGDDAKALRRRLAMKRADFQNRMRDTADLAIGYALGVALRHAQPAAAVQIRDGIRRFTSLPATPGDQPLSFEGR